MRKSFTLCGACDEHQREEKEKREKKRREEMRVAEESARRVRARIDAKHALRHTQVGPPPRMSRNTLGEAILMQRMCSVIVD